MHKRLLPIIVFLFFGLSFVTANTITFANLDLTQQKISIYYSNGTFINEIYSNETFNLPNNTIDYILVIEPNKWLSASNPTTLIDMILDFVGFIFIAIIVLGLVVIILGAIYRGLKYRGAFS